MRITESKPGDRLAMELGIAVGQSHSFGLIAGRCSAAQAYVIRRLREHKLFKEGSETWQDFWPRYLNMSRVEADRIIRHLNEFGTAYSKFRRSRVFRPRPSARLHPRCPAGPCTYGAPNPQSCRALRRTILAELERISRDELSGPPVSEAFLGSALRISATAWATHNVEAIPLNPENSRKASGCNADLPARRINPVREEVLRVAA